MEYLYTNSETETNEECPDTETPQCNMVQQMSSTAVTLLTSKQAALRSHLSRENYYAKSFRGSPQSLLASSGTLPLLANDRFFRNHFPNQLRQTVKLSLC